MGIVQFAIARFVYGTLYQGFRPWSLLRSEFPDSLSVLLVEILLGTITAVIAGPVGVAAFVDLRACHPHSRARPSRPGPPSFGYSARPKLGGSALRHRPRRRAPLQPPAPARPRGGDVSPTSPQARSGRALGGPARHRVRRQVRRRALRRWRRPAALAAAHIPLDSRIVAVAIRWAQLTAAGSQQLSHAEALLGLELAAGAELDPRVVAAAGEDRPRRAAVRPRQRVPARPAPVPAA